MNQPPKPDPLPRRGFLRLASVFAGGAALGACRRDDPYRIDKPDVPGALAWTLGEERHVSTSCGQCASACGVRVRVVEGRAVKIEGNPTSPINRGGIGPRGLSGPQALYDPDRVLKPLRRRAPRGVPAGEGGFEEVSWDEALQAIGSRLSALRRGGGARRLAVIAGKHRGLTVELLRRFARAYGTPNVIDGSPAGTGPVALANLLMQGVADEPAYDWHAARYVLSLGSGVLDSSCQTVAFARAAASARRTAGGGRAKVVHVGPVRTRTAVSADEHVRIRPQTYGAFALGLAHVIVRDGLHDAAFVAEHTLGFEPWRDADGRAHAGLTDVLAEYPPERVAQVCGVAAADVERIALELAGARPAFAIAGDDEFRGSNGLGAAMAVHALNALIGAIDRPGGLLTQREAPLAPLPEFELDEPAETSLAGPALGANLPLGLGAITARGGLAIDRFPEAVLAANEPPDALLCYYANPLYSRAGAERWRAALARVGMVVSFSPQMDETCDEFADWILPDATYLERWEDAGAAPSVGYPVFALRQPTVEPLGEARATGDVLIALAASIGAGVQEALSFTDVKDALKKRVIGLYKAKRGSIVEEGGAAFLNRLYEVGTWSDQTYAHESWNEVLRTPSGRFEFFSTGQWERLRALAVAHKVELDALPSALGFAVDPDRLCLPRHEDARWSGDSGAFPLMLEPYRLSTACEGGSANLPWLHELKPYAGRAMWATEVELHPETARAGGVAEGERAVVRSALGAIEAQVHVDAGVPVGVLRIAQGGGHTACGRYARGVGANVMRLVSLDGFDPLCGASPLHGTRVALERSKA